MKLVAVDIGNTNITFGVTEKGNVLGNWRIGTQLWRTEDEHFILFKELLKHFDEDLNLIQGSVLSCVVPPLKRPVTLALTHLFGNNCVVVEPGIKTGMPVRYNPASNVGADRIVNAVAARAEYPYPAIVIDFGTATTFCVIDEAGEYIGGSIFPGIRTTSDALYRAAAMLPRVSFSQPQNIVGSSTIESIQSGTFYGYIDLVQGMISRIKSAVPGIKSVITTGGLGSVFHQELEQVNIYDPDLTLKGLDLLFNMNNSDREMERW